jgi:hypothetical protein
MSLSLALGLIQFAPKLIGLLDPDTGDKVDRVASTVIDVAKKVTGQQDGAGAVEAIKQHPDLALQFQLAVMENETVLERLDEQSRKRASDQYKAVSSKQADKVADSIIGWNLWIIGGLVIANFGAVLVLETGPLVAVVSNLIGVVIGHLLQERQSVVAFFFGSSLGSKQKSISMAPAPGNKQG